MILSIEIYSVWHISPFSLHIITDKEKLGPRQNFASKALTAYLTQLISGKPQFVCHTSGNADKARCDVADFSDQ